jgi:hypothetical protein
MTTPIYDPTKTAIPNGKSKSTVKLAKENEPCTVLDYGSGQLRNAIFLKDEGFTVDCHDLAKQLEVFPPKEKGMKEVRDIPNNTYDLVLCSFVLNTVPLDIRNTILENIKNTLTKDGTAYFEVRRVCNAIHKEAYGDGYLMGKNKVRTFQKAFTVEGFKDYMSSQGFEIIGEKAYTDSIILKVKKS